MSLQSWWTQTQLRRVENKLKKLRSLQRANREQLDRLEREKHVTPEELERRKAKLEGEREKLTTQISELIEQEQQLKAEATAATAAA